MEHRVVGLETEFGCLVRDPRLGSYESVVERVKDTVFYKKRCGLLDLDKTAGGFLINGGRLYIDVGSHLEYATPECRSLRDLIAYERAGQRLILKVLRELDLHEKVSFYNNSVDHFSGATFGCHENYLVNAELISWRPSLWRLVPFLVTRQIFAGVGRVSGHRLSKIAKENCAVEPDDTIDFQLSQRADHILSVLSWRSPDRTLINPKWAFEYVYNPLRLHLSFGEANPSEYATFLKIGTTLLVLDLLQERAVSPDVELKDPIRALKEVSRDPRYRWLVKRENGATIPAVDLQRLYLEAAQRRFSGRDAETDEILREWEETLDALERDPLELADRLDWVAKLKMLRLFKESEGLDWHDEALYSLDLEYHSIDPEQGLYYALPKRRRLVTEREIELAIEEAPQDTCACGRAIIVRALCQNNVSKYVIGWHGVIVGQRYFFWYIPLYSYAREAERFLNEFGARPSVRAEASKIIEEEVERCKKQPL